MKWVIMLSIACLQHFIPMELRAEKQKKPETDRIGLGETSAITRTRIWRAECGINYSWTGSSLNDQNSISFPFILLRVGIWKKFEIRGTTEYLMLPPEQGALNQEPLIGFNYSSVGAKAHLIEEKKLFPALSSITSIGFGQTGSKRFILPKYIFSLRLLSEKSIGNKTSLLLNMGICGNEKEGLWQGDETLTLSYQVKNEIECYAEAFRNWGGGSVDKGIDAGLFIRYWQFLKMEVTGGITSNGPKSLLFINAGVAVEIF